LLFSFLCFVFQRLSFTSTNEDVPLANLSQPSFTSQLKLTPSYTSRKTDRPLVEKPSIPQTTLQFQPRDIRHQGSPLIPLRNDLNKGEKEVAPTKAVLTALRAMQGKLKRLEDERHEAVKKCEDIKDKIKIVEANSRTKIENSLAK